MSKPTITQANIYMTLDNDGNDIWAYRADDEGGYDHSDTLDADTEEEAKAEIAAMFPAAKITVLPPKQ